MMEVQGTPTPFDASSNKSIIYWARDAIVCIVYTGLAYVGPLPTDDWIVQKLTGVDVSKEIEMRGCPLLHWLDIGQATRLLLRELARIEIADHNSGFEVVAVGGHCKSTM